MLLSRRPDGWQHLSAFRSLICPPPSTPVASQSMRANSFLARIVQSDGKRNTDERKRGTGKLDPWSLLSRVVSGVTCHRRSITLMG